MGFGTRRGVGELAVCAVGKDGSSRRRRSCCMICCWGSSVKKSLPDGEEGSFPLLSWEDMRTGDGGRSSEEISLCPAAPPRPSKYSSDGETDAGDDGEDFFFLARKVLATDLTAPGTSSRVGRPNPVDSLRGSRDAANGSEFGVWVRSGDEVLPEPSRSSGTNGANMSGNSRVSQ